MEFCKAFNAQTQQENGRIIPVEITVYEDRSFDFITKTPPAAVLIKEALRLEKGSGEPNREKVGRLTRAQVRQIAEEKAGPERTRPGRCVGDHRGHRPLDGRGRGTVMSQHGKNYRNARAEIDREEVYSPAQAVRMLRPGRSASSTRPLRCTSTSGSTCATRTSSSGAR